MDNEDTRVPTEDTRVPTVHIESIIGPPISIWTVGTRVSSVGTRDLWTMRTGLSLLSIKV